jgi:uncharacterized membrane protein
MWCWLLTFGIVIVGLIAILAFGIFFTWLLEKLPHPFDAIFLGIIALILLVIIAIQLHNDICK